MTTAELETVNKCRDILLRMIAKQKPRYFDSDYREGLRAGLQSAIDVIDECILQATEIADSDSPADCFPVL